MIRNILIKMSLSKGKKNTSVFQSARLLNFKSLVNVSTQFILSSILSTVFSLPSIYCQTQFTNITEQAGIEHEFGVYDGFLGGGVCVIDINKDGFEDLYLTGGTNEDRFYLNQGDGTFKNIFATSGLAITNDYVTQGVAGADVNRDGWVDLFITTNTRNDTLLEVPRARNLLFINNGDSTFRDATADYGLDKFISFSTGVSFGDFNADGFPDAYIGNYFHEFKGELNEINDATIVNANSTAKGHLLLNKNGQSFENVYDQYGLNHRGFGFGGLFTDYDNDGDLDLLVNHDFGYKAKPNYLLQNNYPKAKMEYVSKELDMDLRINAMTSAVGDYDNNGLLDYFITNIRFNHFMVNQGIGKPFINQSKELGTKLFKISWGANFADFDQDGDLDLFVANGDLNPNCTPMNNFYYQNEGGHFKELGSQVGLNDYGLGRGSVVFDIENDGDLDILVVNQTPVLAYPVPSKTLLYRNDSTAGNWLQVGLEGVQATTRGLGARIKIVIGDTLMIREIDGGGSSHLSQNSTLAHFGLGAATNVDSLIVTWPGGNQQILANQPVNQLLKITETPTKAIPSLVYGLSLIGLFCLLILVTRWSMRG